MCGPQIKKYAIGSCPLNIKEATKDDATTTSEDFLYSGGLSFNPFASTDNERAKDLPDETMASNTHAIKQDNFTLKYYHATDDLQGALSPRSLYALENCSEKLSDSLLYTCDVAAKANESTDITNSHKRSLEDDSSISRIDLQSSSRPRRTKKAKRNVYYSPSSSSETENTNIEKPSAKKRAGRKKKRKGAPNRPLSAYNFFFKQERMRLKNLSSSSDHPKIGFSSMGKIIGTNWKSMSEKAKAPYKALADKDHERYARELEIFEEKERIAAGNYDSMLDIAPRISTSTSTDNFKPRQDCMEKEAYHSSLTSSTNSSITQQEELQDDQEGVNNTLQEVLLEDIEPIPLNEVWQPNSNGYKTLQNEALYGFNFGDFKF